MTEYAYSDDYHWAPLTEADHERQQRGEEALADLNEGMTFGDGR